MVISTWNAFPSTEEEDQLAKGSEEVKVKSSEETLRDMVLTANEYFSRSAVDGGNWWE